jgi:hypothetical protein
MAISFAAPPETFAPPGICQPLDPPPGWLDLRPGRVRHGSATPSASPSRLGVPGGPRSSPRSQSPRARPPSPPGRPLSCRCRRKLLGRGTSTPCIPMVGADAASGSTGWKIPAPARGFVHIRSHFLRLLLRQLSFQLYELGLEFNHGVCDDAGCQCGARGWGARTGGGRIIDVLESPEHAPRNICLRRYVAKIEIVKCLKYWVVKRHYRQLLRL